MAQYSVHNGLNDAPRLFTPAAYEFTAREQSFARAAALSYLARKLQSEGVVRRNELREGLRIYDEARKRYRKRSESRLIDIAGE